MTVDGRARTGNAKERKIADQRRSTGEEVPGIDCMSAAENLPSINYNTALMWIECDGTIPIKLAKNVKWDSRGNLHNPIIGSLLFLLPHFESVLLRSP